MGYNLLPFLFLFASVSAKYVMNSGAKEQVFRHRLPRAVILSDYVDLRQRLEAGILQLTLDQASQMQHVDPRTLALIVESKVTSGPQQFLHGTGTMSSSPRNDQVVNQVVQYLVSKWKNHINDYVLSALVSPMEIRVEVHCLEPDQQCEGHTIADIKKVQDSHGTVYKLLSPDHKMIFTRREKILAANPTPPSKLTQLELADALNIVIVAVKYQSVKRPEIVYLQTMADLNPKLYVFVNGRISSQRPLQFSDYGPDARRALQY